MRSSNVRLKDTVCTIGGDGIVKIEMDNGGVRENKLVTIDQYIAALKDNDENFEFPLFPVGLRKIAKKGKTTVIAIEYPELKMPEIRYRSNTYKNVAIPRSVWISRLTDAPGLKYKLINTYIFALDMPLIGERQKLYDWPFPNFSVSFQNICWGNDTNIQPFIKEGVPLGNYASLMSMYFSASANDDLGWKMRFSAFANSSDMTAILKELGTLSVFPTNALQPESSGINNFDEAFNRMLNR